MEKIKRIAVIGCPGSGKSTFAMKLGKILNIPVVHLDKYMFEGKTRIDQQEFLTAKAALVNEERWIIEGCSITTLEMRFARTDRIIYLQIPRWLCIWRVFKRQFNFNGELDDTGCLKGINWPLIKYIWHFDRDKGQSIKSLREQYSNVEFLIFQHSDELNTYLKNLKP